MSSSGSESDWSESESDSSEASVVTSEFESVADRLRRNDESYAEVEIHDWESDVVEILDALKTNTVVKKLTFSDPSTLNQEAVDRLSEVMKCNKSVESFSIYLGRELECERLFAIMATSGGWSSIQELVVHPGAGFESLSLRENEHLPSFIIQSVNLHTLKLEMAGDEAAPIVEILSRTKVQSLDIRFVPTSSMRNGGTRFAGS